MKDIIELLRRAMKQTEFYVGLGLWALSILIPELAKWKKNEIDSGMASTDGYFLAGLLNFVGVIFMLAGWCLILKLWQTLRKSFTTYHPTVWQFGLSITWTSLKLSLLAFIPGLPIMIFIARNYVDALLNPIRYGAIALVAAVILGPIWFVLTYGSISLTTARGHSRRSIRDSFRTAPYLWREYLLVFFLSILPNLLVIPLRLLSFHFPSLQFVAMGLAVCLAPLAFSVFVAGWMMMAKRLQEKAPALVAKGNLAAISADP